jgi:hypothetical protein
MSRFCAMMFSSFIFLAYFFLGGTDSKAAIAVDNGTQGSSASLAELQPESLLDRAAKPMQLHGDEVTLKFGGESRYRFEYRDDFNLADQLYEDDAVNLLRNRLNVDLKIKAKDSERAYRFFAEGQSAQSFAQNGLNKTNQFVNQIDLRQLFFEINKPIDGVPLAVKVGRQELSYGDERFVGPSNWTNTARVFDAVKLIYNPWEWLQLDTFFSQVVRNETHLADKTVHDDNFYGFYAAYKKIKDHVLDTFIFIRNNQDESLVSERAGKKGDLREYTLGNRFKGKKGAVDYGTEYALQFGRKAHDEIEAWAFHQEFGYTFLDEWGTPRLCTEYNHASGDRNPTDGVVSTFDNLFPTNHNKYGALDFLSLKNMHDVMMGASVKPHPKVSLASEFHWFFLDAKESAWFNASGGAFRAANPNADTQLGVELDLTASYAINKYFTALVGYSHFFAGPFAQDTGGNDAANFAYSQLVFKI